MPITIPDLRRISKNFLTILDKEKIMSVNDLEAKLGKEFLSDEDGAVQEYVSILNIPSNQDAMAFTVSYVRPGTGIPIELKINPVLDYSQVIIKAKDMIGGYLPFGSDEFDNIYQSKLIRSSDFSLSIKELKKLSEYKSDN